MSLTAAQLMVMVGADIADMEAQLKKASGGFQGFADGLISNGTKMTALVTLPLAALGTQAVKATADFETNMNVLQATSGAFIVEGICVLQILDRLGIRPDAFVYVKRVAHGYWLDEDHFDPQLPIEDHLAGVRESIRPVAEMLGESGEQGLAEEVIRYHAEYRPHERATIVFLRNDS